MILLRRSTMLAKIKEKDVIDQLLDQAQSDQHKQARPALKTKIDSKK